jgi:GTPase KRas protein
MKNSHGFVIVYSITSRSTLDEAAGIYEQILREKDSDRVPAVLVANKCDLSDQRDVSRAEGEALAKSLSCKHIEASAKKRHNIDQIFYEVVLSILSMTIPQQRSQTQLKPEQPKKKHHKSKHCTLI